MGRANARDAGKTIDPQTVLGIILLVTVTTVLILIQTALWLSHLMTGAPDKLSMNPFLTVIRLYRGSVQWTLPATIILGCIIGLLAGVGVWITIRRVKKPTIRVDKAAKHLAGRRDIQSLSRAAAVEKSRKWLPQGLADTHPGLRMGKIPNTKTGLYSTWEDLYLVIFGPRMGKTTSQVIPAIVDAPGPVLTTSNKRDIIDDTIGITAARGDVYVFDPQWIAPEFEQEPWYFDPLDIIRREPRTMDAAATELADIFKCASSSSETTGGDAFFVDGGRDLLARLFLAATVANRPITDVYIWVNDQDDRTPVGLLKTSGEWDMQASALESTYNITEKTRSGIFSQAAQMASPLGRKAAAQWVTPQSGARKFSPEAFVRSAHDTLYVLSKEGADNAAALTTALTAAVMKAAETYGEENGGRLPVPLVAPLDEAANVVRWPQLPRLYSHYGSRSIILMTILQSYAQGVGVWGEEGMESLWSAAAILLYGGGVRDEKMLAKLESLIGDYEEWTTSVSNSKDSRSVSKQTREKKILTVSELASLGDNRAVVFAAKRRPIVAELEPFWRRDYWPADIKAGLRMKKS